MAILLLVSAAAGAEEGPSGWVAQPPQPPWARGEARRFELALYPVNVQLNAHSSQQLGSALALEWHVADRLAVQVLGNYDWHSSLTAFSRELVEKVRSEAPLQELSSTWSVQAGLEMSPVKVEFEALRGTNTQLSVGLLAAVGLGGTRAVLLADGTGPAGVTHATVYGDTGVRFQASGALAAKLRVGQHFAIRLELRNLVFSSSVSTVNGCSAQDLRTISERLCLFDTPSTPIGPGCDEATFSGSTPDGVQRSNLAALALNLTRSPGGVIQQLGLYLGASWIF